MFVSFKDIKGDICFIKKDLVKFGRVSYSEKEEGYVFDLWINDDSSTNVPSRLFDTRTQAELALRTLLSD